MTKQDMVHAIERKPTTTVLLPRLPIFLPTFRPATRVGEWVDTPAGRCRVRGRLGQRHETLLEAICRYYTRRHVIPGEPAPEVDVLVDPADLRRALAGREGGWYSYQQMRALVSDLLTTEIEIDTTRHGQHILVHGALVSTFTEYRDFALRNPMGGDRHPLRVRLGVAYTLLAGVDIPRFWDPAAFRNLRSGVGQAVARWLWTQDAGRVPRGGWHLDTLIRAVHGDAAITSIALRHRRRELRGEVQELAALGITITRADRVLYDGRLAARGEGLQHPPGDPAWPVETCSTRPVACSTRPVACSTRPVEWQNVQHPPS